VDGILKTSPALAGALYAGSASVLLGQTGDFASYFRGNLDDVRITKGVARYIADFAVPTEAFANSLPPPDVTAIATAPALLGEPAVLTFFGDMFYVRAAADSPLGAPAVLAGHSIAAWSAATSPLGAPAVTAQMVITARASTPSPLSAAATLIKHDFTGVLGDSITRWVMDLITPAGTLRVPISSWQATLQSGSSSYVQCVVPACLNWVDAINTATEFVIYRRADVPGTALSIEYEMARSLAEQARFNQGSQRYTCTLSGYPDAFAEDLDPPVAYDRTLTGVRSISSGSGLRVRCAVDWLLRPGHRAYVGAVPFVVRFINYYALESDSYMDVGE
jgi:hypothetical protein